MTGKLVPLSYNKLRKLLIEKGMKMRFRQNEKYSYY